MTDGVDAVAVRDAMVERGVIPRPIGAHTLAFCPPLTIGATDLDQVIEITGEALRSVQRLGE